MTESPIDTNKSDSPNKAKKSAAPAGRHQASARARKGSFIDRMTVETALRNYRIMAWVVGVPLALLFLVGMPLKYLGENGTPVTIIGIAHGYLYMLYIVSAVLLSLKRHWDLKRTAIVVLCGTIPLVSFYTEHVVHKKVIAREPGW